MSPHELTGAVLTLGIKGKPVYFTPNAEGGASASNRSFINDLEQLTGKPQPQTNYLPYQLGRLQRGSYDLITVLYRHTASNAKPTKLELRLLSVTTDSGTIRRP
jgi:hypothetical protein